jgi:hypothetical protein
VEDVTDAVDRYAQILRELEAIRSELRGLRALATEHDMRAAVESRVQELEVEERLLQLQDEVDGAKAPPRPKRRPWRKQ